MTRATKILILFTGVLLASCATAPGNQSIDGAPVPYDEIPENIRAC